MSDNTKPGPLIGYKTVLLRLNKKDGKIYFQSPTYNSLHSVLETSVCRIGDPKGKLPGYSHVVTSNCTCGFYSFKEASDAWGYEDGNGRRGLIIETVSSGTFIEYSNAQRGEKQRVRTILVSDCAICLIPNDATAFVKSHTNNSLIPVCLPHAKSYPEKNRYTFGEISANIATPENYRFKNPEVKTFPPNHKVAATSENFQLKGSLDKSISIGLNLMKIVTPPITRNRIVIIQGQPIRLLTAYYLSILAILGITCNSMFHWFF